jgi:hypothetical protein
MSSEEIRTAKNGRPLRFAAVGVEEMSVRSAIV